MRTASGAPSRRRGWLGMGLDGKTLGIVGTGRIGQAVAAARDRLRDGDVHTRRTAGSRSRAAPSADVVTLHCPLTEETRGLIDARGARAHEADRASSSTPRAGRSSTRRRCSRRCSEADRRRRAGRHRPRAAARRPPAARRPQRARAAPTSARRRSRRATRDDRASRVANLEAGLAGRAAPRTRRRRLRRMTRVAVVDIGTNSTRLLVADVEAGARDRARPPLDRHAPRRGRRGDRRARRRADCARVRRARRVPAAIDEHGATSDRGADERRPRRGQRRASSPQRVRDRYGLDADTISRRRGGAADLPRRHRGARPADDRRRLLVVDIGGGSTELVAGAPGRSSFHVSTQVGVVRHTERYLHHDPPSRRELDALARGRARHRRAAASRPTSAPASRHVDRRRRHGNHDRRDGPRARALRPDARRGPPSPRHAARRSCASSPPSRSRSAADVPACTPTARRRSSPASTILTRSSRHSAPRASRSPTATSSGAGAAMRPAAAL